MQLEPSKFRGVMERVAKDLKSDPHHRLLSWDHAWEHWRSFIKSPKGDESLAALHLAFYLASWGMYRGSSNLLFRDFKALIPVVRFLKAKTEEMHDWEDCFFDSKRTPDELTVCLETLAKDLTKTLKEKLKRPDKPHVNVTDTLLSKILLNTLGCVTAFDTEVKAALRDVLGKRNYPIGDAFHKKRLTITIALARENKKLVQSGQELLIEKTGREYPLTKVLDLYLWHHGSGLG